MNAATPSTSSTAASPAPRATPVWRSQLGTYLGLLAVLAGMVGLFSWLSEFFWSAETFVTIANEIPALAVMAVGMTFVLIIAGIDLSVGSVMALSAATSAAAILQWGWTVPAAAALALATGLVCGTITGTISVAWRLPSTGSPPDPPRAPTIDSVSG